MKEKGVEARGDADCFERVELIIFFVLKSLFLGHTDAV